MALIFPLFKSIFVIGVSLKVGSILGRKIIKRFFLRKEIYKGNISEYFNAINNDNEKAKILQIYLLPGKLNFSLNNLKNEETSNSNFLYKSNLVCIRNSETISILNVENELIKLNSSLKSHLPKSLEFEDFMESAEYLIKNNPIKLNEFFFINVNVEVNKNINSKSIIFDRMITKLILKLIPMEIVTKKLENYSNSQNNTSFFVSKRSEIKENIYFDIYVLGSNSQSNELTKSIIHLFKEIPYINVLFCDREESTSNLVFSEVFSINNINYEITNYLIDDNNNHTMFLYNLLNDLKKISQEKIIPPVDKIKFNNLL